jgi:hypothetical protein
MNCLLSQDDLSFKNQVEQCTFPIQEFSHRNHVRLAYIYLVNNDASYATQLMRSTLVNLLSYYKVDPTKYSETLTQSWILLVMHFMAKTNQALSSENFIEQNTQLLDSAIMYTYYSKAVLVSERARLAFVEPDLEIIPIAL